MRVLRISHSAAIDQWRGRERALRARGLDVTLLSARRWHAGGAEVVLEPRAGEQATAVGTLGRHPALFVYDPRPLWRALGERWDVIDIHEEPFALATAEVLVLRWARGVLGRLGGLRGRWRAPVVLYTAQNLRKRYPVPFRWLERWALRNAAGISACNTEAARIAQDKGFAGRAQVIPLGIDLAEFMPEAEVGAATAGEAGAGAATAGEAGAGAATAGEAGADAVTVGFIGRLVPEKGLDVLLRALQAQPRLRVRIAGSGPLGDELAGRARSLGIADRVTMVGPLDPAEVPAFYRSLDVLAVPSLPRPGWTEQFGRVAIEAMACGIPVVSSDAGALPDVVGGAGIVVAGGDSDALGEALVAAAGPRAAELRAAGFVRAAECSWGAVAERYEELYRSVVHEASTSSVSAASALEVIVVAYGAPGLLRAALDPVVGMPVTVVDNSSLPEIAALCAELGVRYVDAGANLGFAAGVNLVLADRLVPGADVLLLNPDARIDAGQIAVLHSALRSESDLASVGPSQVDEQGRPARVEWPLPSPRNAWLEAMGLGRQQGGAQFVIGSVLLLRAEALEQVGGLDERFFLYAEETDWAYRAHRLGWRHRAVPAARALHVGAGTSSDSRRREAHFHASQERYYRKHFGAAAWQGVRAAVWAGALARSVVLPGERGRAARRRAALYRLGPVRIEARFRAAAP